MAQEQISREESVFKSFPLEIINITFIDIIYYNTIVGVIIISASSFIKERYLIIFYIATSISSPEYFYKYFVFLSIAFL